MRSHNLNEGHSISGPALLALLLCCSGSLFPARAHSMYQAALLLDYRGTAIDAELQLPLERLSMAIGQQLSRETVIRANDRINTYTQGRISASLADGRLFCTEPMETPVFASIEGAPYVIVRLRLVPPRPENANRFDLHCNILLDRIPSQVILVSTRTDWRTSTFATDPQLLGVLRETDRTLRIDRRNGSWWNGFASLFRLGSRHIAEGTDHLLFHRPCCFPRRSWFQAKDGRVPPKPVGAVSTSAR